MDKQSEHLLIALFIIVLIFAYLSRPNEIEIDKKFIRRQNASEREWIRMIEAYGGYDNYEKRQLIEGCLDACDPPEEDCGYCYDIK